MTSLMASPIPLVVAAIVFSALSWAKIRDNPWVKWPRRIVGIILALFTASLVLSAIRTVAVAGVPRSPLRGAKTQQNAASQASQAIGAGTVPQPER